MILDRIVLRNYGVYRGTHEAVLTPFVGKPIILFGGLNGGGKTTLLDAFQLALYGSRARLSNRGRLAYKDYLAQSINRNARPGEWAEVQLDFTKVLTGKLTRFSVTRSWRDSQKGVAEELSVSVNGNPDPVFTEHWDEIVDTYLPSSISHLFFFDGEQISNVVSRRRRSMPPRRLVSRFSPRSEPPTMNSSKDWCSNTLSFRTISGG
jgi:DNA sulfur modification protein DndD